MKENWDDEDSTPYDDAPYDDADERDFDDEEPTIDCPYCGREIHEESQRCPHCENYISAEDAPRSRKPWWIIVGVLLCFYVVYQWVVH
jgi:hypothetical protein